MNIIFKSDLVEIAEIKRDRGNSSPRYMVSFLSYGHMTGYVYAETKAEAVNMAFNWVNGRLGVCR